MLGLPAKCVGGPLDGAEGLLPASEDARTSGMSLLACVDDTWHVYRLEPTETGQVLQHRGEILEMPKLAPKPQPPSEQT